ncbi:transcription factor IIIB 60 kDa subunit-like [Salvia splendens]|uniref:transcription factor IIIB 60 kDa subunit-like n=1 Tax=Salvia splendens TaxID=180675 RepID=UPI001C253977|nr:transcription factor IIIB 60 kDa subunit-like [Salvia splendens]
MVRIWCPFCAINVRTDTSDGKTCCSLCGRVLSEDNFTEEVQFTKSSDGQARMQGRFVASVQSNSESRERTLNEAYNGINDIMYALEIDGGDYIASAALRLYKMALDKNFTKGRRKEQVQASCLYIVCRVKDKPFLLIDFSEHIRINVYVLGAVFLQLCKVLSLEETGLLQKLVDPSLFIHRFADRLFRSKNQHISKTALQIVASMKRDWMQSGRKPSGICGAALYISALAHGLNCSKSDVIKTVHICEATLTKRMIEFENTESGGLTIEEFEKKSKELAALANNVEDKFQMKSRSGELLCSHKGDGKPQFAYGLCKDCYKEFMELSGGLNGGSEPPAFQRAERKRIMAEEAAADRSENLDSSTLLELTETNSKHLNYDGQRSLKNTQDGATKLADPDLTGATLKPKTMHDTIDGRTDASDITLEESESLSDIDDFEVDVYINTEEEKILKTTVWEEINREYLEEQKAKEAAAVAAKKAYEASLANCSGDVEGARKLAEAAAAAAAQIRKEKRQKRAADLKNLGPPETAKDAFKQMLNGKPWSSKIRYELLEQLIDSDEQSPKKSRNETKDEAETKAETDQDDYVEDDPEVDGAEDNTEEYNYDQDINDLDEF